MFLVLSAPRFDSGENWSDLNEKNGVFFLYLIEQADGDAALGKYVAGSCVGAAAEYDLFIKNHSY